MAEIVLKDVTKTFGVNIVVNGINFTAIDKELNYTVPPEIARKIITPTRMIAVKPKQRLALFRKRSSC